MAREKAVRAVHEAHMHENNIFLTLTYDDEHLKSPKLIYEDWQKFAKSLRDKIGYAPEKKISYMVTGEYGELFKRPHWHAIIFNYKPTDSELKYVSHSGERVFDSKSLTKLWNKGQLEYGSVTIESAGYVARYAAKKLTHGRDQDHDYHPIHKTSSARAIGRSWIEKHWKHTFENGFIVLPNGEITKIPRYYVDWLKKHRPSDYVTYVTTVREGIINKAERKARREEMEFLSTILNYKGGSHYPRSRPQVQERVLQSKFKQLQERLKL